MANLLIILLIIPNLRLFFAAAQPPASVTTVACSTISSISSPPPTTTINSSTPPPQQIQLHNIIYAACDFAGWANILSDVSVHEIGTILRNTVYGSPTAQHPPSEVANNQRSGSPTIFTDYYLVFSIFCAVFAFNIEIESFCKMKIVLFLCGLCFAVTAHGISLDGSCALDYIEGGAPAIFKSPRCTAEVEMANSYKRFPVKCGLATRQGHRPYQEDHMSCNLIKMPVHGSELIMVATVDVLAIFDGHGGAEASEMANQKLLDYFIIHVWFHAIKEAIITLSKPDLSSTSCPRPRLVFEPVHISSQNTLKEALLHAIHDIDMEFSLEAFKKRYYGGSTATVVLLLNDEEILVASLGDSPALLCRGWKRLKAEKLTRNHRPDEEDERARIEAAGGFVQVVGVPRVNGKLAVSRAIGDISFKSFGVIAEPEVKGWRNLTMKDRYLVIASDGIFKGGLTPDDVCKIIEQGGTAQSIVIAALKDGSMDNLSATVFPLKQLSKQKYSEY